MSAPRASRVAAALLLLLLGAGAAAAAPTPAQVLGEIPRRDFLAEGIGIAPHGVILVSGVQGRTILKFTARGAAPWLRGRASGGLFGMAVDVRRDRLWVAETGGAGVPGSRGARTTDVLEVRLSDGRMLQRHAPPGDGKPHWIGDLLLGEDGTVYASDSVNGQVYRLKRSGGPLEVLSETGLKSLQGLVLAADGKSLILADYPTGLHHIDLATGAVGAAMASPDGDVRGIDGLKRHGRDLIATRNGSALHSVMRLRLSPDETVIEHRDILAIGPQVLEDVSLGAVDGERLVLVARSGWAGFDDQGQANGKPVRPPVIAAVPLGPAA